METRSAFGVGLRVPHYDQFLGQGLAADVGEALTENFLRRGGRPGAVLERVRRDSRVFLHGVSLSVGAVDELNLDYVRAVRDLAKNVDAVYVSDHLSFGSHGGRYAHDLWPLPFTEECIVHVVQRIARVQDLLGRRLVLENVSSYVEYAESEMTEWEFVTQVAARADCLVLFDVNNVYVNSVNHRFDPKTYVDAVDAERIAYVHLAGHSDLGEFLLDDHGSAVPDPVLSLYERLVRRIGPVPTIVEWDENVPSLDRLLVERDRARDTAARALAPAAKGAAA